MLTEGFYIFYHIQLLCGIFSLFFYRFQSCSFQVNGQNVKVDVIRNLKNVIFSDNKITIFGYHLAFTTNSDMPKSPFVGI